MELHVADIEATGYPLCFVESLDGQNLASLLIDTVGMIEIFGAEEQGQMVCLDREYTVELARLYPQVNFIGVDIKGARMHKGAKEALTAGLSNVAFLRTNIEIIDRFFAKDEVQEIWLTFSDPQMKNPRKRLTSTYFMNRYRHFLV